MPCPCCTCVPSIHNALVVTAVVCEQSNAIPSAPSLNLSVISTQPRIFCLFHLSLGHPSILSELWRAQCKHKQPSASFRRSREGHIEPPQLCVPFAYEKTVSKGLFIMHKSLLTCLYCNNLFLPLTIQALFASAGEICPFWIIQSLISATELHLTNTHAHSRIKRQRGLQGYYNNTSLSPLGEVGILLPSCQKLSDALPYGGHSLLEGNTTYTAGPFRSCLSCAR